MPRRPLTPDQKLRAADRKLIRHLIRENVEILRRLLAAEDKIRRLTKRSGRFED